jgi:hypothetical protein
MPKDDSCQSRTAPLLNFFGANSLPISGISQQIYGAHFKPPVKPITTTNLKRIHLSPYQFIHGDLSHTRIWLSSGLLFGPGTRHTSLLW